MLTDQIVRDLRDKANKDSRFNITQHAKEIGIDDATLGKALRGLSYKHLNEVSPPFTDRTDRSALREKARSLYRQGKTYLQITQELGISKSTVSLYCRDLVANPKKSPKRKLPADFEDTCRKLYLEGKTVNEVAAVFGVSRCRISKVCQDLIANRKIELSKQAVVNKEKRRVAMLKTNRHQFKLSDDTVVAMRREIKESGIKNWALYAKRYEVTTYMISMAARGMTYTHLNDVESPVTDDNVKPMRKRCKKPPRQKVDENLLSEAITMLKSDPIRWSLSALAEWMNEKAGGSHVAGHIARAMYNRDPSLRNLTAAIPKVAKPSSSQQKRSRAQEQARRRAAFRRMIAEEDAYEAAHS